MTCPRCDNTRLFLWCLYTGQLFDSSCKHTGPPPPSQYLSKIDVLTSFISKQTHVQQFPASPVLSSRTATKVLKTTITIKYILKKNTTQWLLLSITRLLDHWNPTVSETWDLKMHVHAGSHLAELIATTPSEGTHTEHISAYLSKASLQCLRISIGNPFAQMSDYCAV